MLHRLALVLVLGLLMVFGATGTASSASQATKAQALAAGWDCNPNITILGYFHCAAPGEPSLLDVIIGAATPPTLHLNVYNAQTELLAGTELLIRADFFRGQPCPQEGGSWTPLDFGGSPGPEYYACHHFAA
jgi:hypothetical protein